MPDSAWYRQVVFKGELLQAPRVLASGDIIVFTGDGAIQRFNFERGTVWKHAFEWIPWQRWFVQEKENLHIVMREHLLSFSPWGFIGRSNFLWPASRPRHSLTIVDGRIVRIDDTGELTLFPGLSMQDEALIRWNLPSSEWKKLIVSPQGTLIVQTRYSLFWYSLDGRLLSEASIGSGWDEFVLLGSEIVLHSPPTGHYRRYDLNGEKLFARSSPSPGRGRLVAAVPLHNGTSFMHFHIDDRRVLLYGPDGQERVLLRIDKPWNYEHVAFHEGQLFLSDSIWRLHRFDAHYLARSFFKQDLKTSAPIIKEELPASDFLSRVLINLSGTPEELLEQLTIMAANVGNRPGRVTLYELALIELIEYMYTGGENYGLRNPLLRSSILTHLLHYAGTQSTLRVVEFLRAEVSPLVYTKILPLFIGKSTYVHRAVLERLNNFLQGARDWQRSPEFIKACFEYFVAVYMTDQSETSGLGSRALAGLNRIYNDIDNPTMRRQILNFTSPLLDKNSIF